MVDRREVATGWARKTVGDVGGRLEGKGMERRREVGGAK